jgi:hypothetical protein
MHGKFVVHPVDGRRIPLICDAELVDMSFGTGAVKVCVSSETGGPRGRAPWECETWQTCDDRHVHGQ